MLFIDFLLDDILLVNELAHLEEFTLVDGALTLISALRSVIVVNELAHLEEFTLVDGALTLISALRSVIVVNELCSPGGVHPGGRSTHPHLSLQVSYSGE